MAGFKSYLFSAVILITGLNFATSFNLAEPSNKNQTLPASSTTSSPTNSTDVDVTKNGTETSSNSTGSPDLDDRFNFNLNRAGAFGVGRYGGVSQSDALSYGINAGIRHRNGQYQNLYSKTGSNSNTYSYGPGAPLTYANTASRNRPGYGSHGNAQAGLYGGIGNTYAQSQNQHFEIPLDNRGTVLLSNLKERDNSTSSSTTAASTSPSSSSPASTKSSTTAASTSPSSSSPASTKSSTAATVTNATTSISSTEGKNLSSTTLGTVLIPTSTSKSKPSDAIVFS